MAQEVTLTAEAAEVGEENVPINQTHCESIQNSTSSSTTAF